jgi:nitroreductase
MTHSVPAFEPLSTYQEYSRDEMLARARHFLAEMKRRRTVRQFSDRPVPRAVLDACLEAAGTAPSGANQQPWHFVVVSDPALKREIRLAAEAEEDRFYRTAPVEWLAALAPLGTDAHKPYLEIAPYLIACSPNGMESRRRRDYALLRDGIRGDCHRHPHHGAASRRVDHPDAHPEPDGLPQSIARPARDGAADHAARDGIPGGRRRRPAHSPEIARPHRDLSLMHLSFPIEQLASET